MENQFSLKRKIDSVLKSLDEKVKEVPPVRSRKLAKPQAVSKPQPDGEKQKQAQRPPLYTPWDRNRLIERLSAFRVWPYQRFENINSLEWARQGWKCTSRTEVACVLCGSERTIQMKDGERELSEETLIALSEKYHDMIRTAHAEGCFWRRKGCDATLLRISFASQRDAIEGFQKRRDTFKSNECNIVTEIPADAVNDSINDTPSKLALFGWELIQEKEHTMLQCQVCQRRCGLWSFDPAKSRTFDCILEHQNFCPWVNATVQGDGKPGWQTQWKILCQSVQQKDLNKDQNAGTFDFERLKKIRQFLALK